MNEKQLYFITYYFVVSTITTVGYGDIYAFNSNEKIIIFFYQIIGVTFFSIFSGILSEIVNDSDKID